MTTPDDVRTTGPTPTADFPPPEVVAAVLGHMNADHRDDSALICRAHGQPATTAATMTGFDVSGADFLAETPAGPTAVRVPWHHPVTDRAQVRAEVVRLYEDACAALGVDPRPH